MDTLPIVYCMMQQNRLLETKHCIDVVRPHVDEMVIVDGGSVDDSIFYLRNRADVHMFLHPWKDHFSEQRTHYLNHAREIMGTDDFWVLVSDPDEWYIEDTARNLRGVQAFATERGFDSVAFQCRCVTLKGEERVYENLDQYWKALYFRYKPGMRYIGNPHETLIDGEGRGPNPMRVDLIYEHVKQENVHWHRGLRNMYVGGGGPNLGAKNALWIELKDIVTQVYGRLLTWHEFEKELIKGNLDQRLKDWLIKVRLEDGWDGSCFTPGQYLISEGGAIPFNHVKTGDSIFGASGLTNAVYPIEKMYDGKVVTIRGINTIPITVTKNHRILVAERNACTNGRSGKWCKPSCAYSIPAFRKDNRNEKWSGTYRNCSTDYCHDIKWVEAGNIVVGKHVLLYPKSKELDMCDWSLDLCELFGWYLAEGNVNGGCVAINTHLFNDPHDRIVSLIKSAYGIDKVSYYDREDSTSRTISFYLGKDGVKNYSDMFGSVSTCKHVPNGIFNANNDRIKAFIKGAICGDGSIYKKPGSKYSTIVYSTASKRLAHEMQYLLSKIGVFAGFSKQEDRIDRFSTKPIYRLTIDGKQVEKMVFLGYTISHSDRQMFYEDDNYFYLPCTSTCEEDYCGPVYNVETSDNTYLSGVIVHNSEHREAYKTYFRIYHPEEEPEELKYEHIP